MAAYDNKVLTGEQLTTLVGKIKDADAEKQNKLDAENKLNPAFVNTNSENRFVTDSEKTAWSAKADTSDIPTNLSELTEDTTHRVVTDTEKATWNGKANVSDIPDSLDDLSDDATHRLVTDAEKTSWNGKTTMEAVEAKGYQTSAQVTSAIEGYGYQTSTQVTNAINSAIAGLTGFHFEVVTALPTQDQDPSAIYLILKASGESGNIYTEYAWINNAWEQLGDTQLSIETLSATEVDTIWNSVSAS